MPKPVFTDEGPQFYRQAYATYSPFATPGLYSTVLAPAAEARFRGWVAKNKILFSPDAKIADYDMRGWWKANGRPGVSSAPRAAGQHFSDRWKTPYDTTFSSESRYATANNPFDWVGDKLIDTRNGRVMFAPAQSQSSMAIDAIRRAAGMA